MSQRQRQSLPPEAAAVLRAMSARQPSRRSVLGAGALGLGAAALTACGTSGGTSGGAAAPSGVPTATVATGPSPAADRSSTEKVVRWANWTLYLDYDTETKKYPSLEAFKKQTGIDATYSEDVEDNETYYGKVQAQLRQGQDIGKDIITLTDWMAARLVTAKWVQKLDQSVIANGKNILDSLKDPGWDPGRNYSYTWQSGFAGLGYNVAEYKKATGKTEMKSLADLWDPKLKGRVTVLSEMRDTIGLILRAQGVDINKTIQDTQWENGLAELEKQLSAGQIRQVKGNSYKEDLISGDAIAAICWSGDIFQLNSEAKAKDKSLTSDPYAFVVPDSGGTLWSDNLMVPVGSPYKGNAELLINYYYEPSVAAKVAAYVNYICPVKGAQEEMAKLPDVDKSVVESPLIFPGPDDLKNVQMFVELDAKTTLKFTEGFQKVLGV